MRPLYALLAVLGTVLPYWFFWPLIADAAPLGTWLEQWFASPAAGGVTADLFISSFVFWAWSWGEARRFEMKRWWGYVVLNLLVGLSLALPLFLYNREGRLSEAVEGRT